ncbi:hypothetical protein JRC04_04800 [Mycolicibacterium sp. S2-37]|uniref:Gp37-like protein n=1 Tax=Mycolicibacterium sp. S2-37 TaxID=2810297 RepID=UPI001A953198|nr:hypothetical protein [Mycolicibacterium sp. S2-37]MBO0676778.1 hypothetical protein [Mycolicibacterium sp. S2-37]
MARIDNLQDYINVASAKAALLGNNDALAMKTAQELAALDQHPPTDISVSIRDNYYRRKFETPDYLHLEVDFPRLAIPTGKLILKGNDPAADHVLNCDKTVVPVVIDLAPDEKGFGRLRWSGRVDVALDKFDGKQYTIECKLLHDKAWLTRIVAWVAWWMPIQIQGPPSRGIAFGGAVSVIKYIITSNVLRLQLGLWDLVNNLFSLNLDWRTWFRTALMFDPGEKLELRDIGRFITTPIYVVPTNPFFDTSPFISLDWRFDEILQLVNKTCEDNGLTIEVTLWEPGMPQPDELSARLKLLQVPTIVVDVKDRMQVTGFSGTFLDGIQRTFIDLIGSMFGEVLRPFLDPKNEAQYAPEGTNIAPLLGLHFVKPWAVFTDHPRGGLKQFEFAHHHPIAWRTITGGKSPKWMNDFVDATLTWLIDMIMIVIGFTGIPGSILNGVFNDILLAFQLTDNFDRCQALGPYGFPEKFVPTGSGSYTLEAFFQQKSAQWDTRGYVSAQVVVDNGYPYELGRDIFPGALATVIRRGKVFTDFIENAKLVDNRQQRASLTIQIGDGRAEEAPIAKIQRRLVDIQEGVNIVFMAQ